MGNHLHLKTSYADGPLCGFSTLFNWSVYDDRPSMMPSSTENITNTLISYLETEKVAAAARMREVIITFPVDVTHSALRLLLPNDPYLDISVILRDFSVKGSKLASYP